VGGKEVADPQVLREARGRTPKGESAGKRRVEAVAAPARASLYATMRPFWTCGALVVVFVLGHFYPPLAFVGRFAVLGFAALLALDAWALWMSGGALTPTRTTEEKLSNGDPNPVRLEVASTLPFATRILVLDEPPAPFVAADPALRALRFETTLPPGERATFAYTVRPTERGAYGWGAVNAYATGPLGLLHRRFRAGEEQTSPVYPSIVQMRRYAFLAATNRLVEAGVRPVRRRGHAHEFDRLRDYAPGDDVRRINWMATARRRGRPGGGLVTNEYHDERQQPLYAALDMGRAMREAFDGLTLLDHSVNAALALLNVALIKGDKAGLVAFGKSVESVVPAAGGPRQRVRLLESLYALAPSFEEPGYGALYGGVRARMPKRGLFLLFTNFETRTSLRRRLPHLRALARRHRLVVVFFENTGVQSLVDRPAERLADVYIKAQAERLADERRAILETLQQAGIGALLTTPETLTVDAINRYLVLRQEEQ
jgi:uncharacterized protein (DUF58 family)